MIFIILKFVGNNLCHAQGWQFALLLIRSKSLILKSNLTKKRATWVIRSWLERITLKKQAICLKKFLFFYVFHCFSPFYAQELIIAPDALSLFLKERRTRRYLQKSTCERFTLLKEQIALSLTKNEQFAWKTKEWIPTLVILKFVGPDLLHYEFFW